ncbi:MAG TPA: cellulase family glycosylhydrolase [Candidatus Paceibacterota bacterium]|nr:cellulase family glycosylhydrolase [Candidatus Paceibacterota bacterium]HRZ34425.1 cellulase family glycosylhydrolase [Candidatus Paceibacterota bacterium]
METLKKILKSKKFILSVVFVIVLAVAVNWPSEMSEYEYGLTFSAKYARELNLNPEETFDAIINDLNIKKVRLVAYWDEIEAEKDIYDFTDLDWQIKKAEENDLSVILAIGRRVPRWPECHFPEWVYGKSWENQQDELIDYLREIVNRYKDSKAVTFWQIENEPFLTAYVPEICGSELDRNFLDEEIALVRRLDPSRRIIATDSGNIGTWLGAYKRGHIFGSTFYIYLANPRFGEVKSFLNHNYYKFKRALATLLYGYKPTYLIEVSMEPWLIDTVMNTPIDEQLEAMNIDRINEIIEISAKTNFDDQYLWGAEWWYYLKQNGHPEIWDYLKERLFSF